MTTLIHERVTPHVAVLRSKDCPNMKSIMSKTIQQLLENVDVVSTGKLQKMSLTLLKHSRITQQINAPWYNYEK